MYYIAIFSWLEIDAKDNSFRCYHGHVSPIMVAYTHDSPLDTQSTVIKFTTVWRQIFEGHNFRGNNFRGSQGFKLATPTSGQPHVFS